MAVPRRGKRSGQLRARNDNGARPGGRTAFPARCNPATHSYEQRLRPCAARVNLPRRPAPPSWPTDQRPRRDGARRGACRHGPRSAKRPPDLHDAKQSRHRTLVQTKRSTACRCHAVDPIVFLLRTIIPLFRERTAARGCFEAFPLPVSHRRQSREAGGRFPYRCRI